MDREERTKAYLAARARPGERKTVTANFKHPKLAKFKPKVRADRKGNKLILKAGWCPCATCGHEFMWECEDADCQCCSSFCT